MIAPSVVRNPNRGTELGYAQNVADQSEAAGTLTDMTNLSVSVNVGSRPVMIKFDAGFVVNNNVAGATQIRLLRGSTGLKDAFVKALTINGGGPCHFEVRDNQPAGTYTYKAQMAASGGGTSTVYGTTVNSYPSIQVVEV